MKRGRITSGILAMAVAAVLGVSITAASSASDRTGAQPQAAQRQSAQKRFAQQQSAQKQTATVVLNCLGKPQVKPGDLVLACADGNSSLIGMSWTSWTPKLASATGIVEQNDCVPDCAEGHLHRYPVLAMLWGPAGYAGGHRYSEITLVFPGARPPIYNGHQWVTGPRTVTSGLWGPPPRAADLTSN
jgi:hypothetical protein